MYTVDVRCFDAPWGPNQSAGSGPNLLCGPAQKFSANSSLTSKKKYAHVCVQRGARPVVLCGLENDGGGPLQDGGVVEGGGDEDECRVRVRIRRVRCTWLQNRARQVRATRLPRLLFAYNISPHLVLLLLSSIPAI